MDKDQLKKFREYYFPGITITESRALMCAQFGVSERCARSWEQGAYPVRDLFIKAATDFDKDGVLK